MKFIINPEVFEKFPSLFVAIPVIEGFSNTSTPDRDLLVSELKSASEKSLMERFSSVNDFISSDYIHAYFETFRDFGVNPKKVKPTHFALGKRVIEGGHLPSINPIVDIYNSFSIKYVTPFGGEDLDTVYGDFQLKFALGNEHWLGIGEKEAKSPKKGDLIWGDDYDTSTLSLNWRQCDRTKLVESSTNGYFIMDGFKGVNDTNILQAATEFSDIVVKHFGGKYKIYTLDKENPSVEIPFETKSVEGLDIPKVVLGDNKGEVKVNQEKKAVKFIYPKDSIELKIQNELWKAIGGGVEINDIDVSLTKDVKYGDYSSTVAMRLSPIFKKAPIQIGNDIVSKLDGIIEKAEVVNPGFINMYIKKTYIKNIISDYSKSYGVNTIGNGKKVMVEFGQPNTHKALQLGHFKSAITGLAIARMYENNGYEVIKANYFGDIGLQVSNCIWGVINRNGTWYSKFGKEDLEEIKENLTTIINDKGVDAAALYLDQSYVFGRKLSSEKDNVLAEVKDINKKIYEESDPLIIDLYHFTRDISIRHQDKAFKELGVEYDIQYPESVVWKLGKEIVLKNVDNIFVKDDGAIIFEGEKYGLQRWVFLTSAGFPSYSGKDLGLAVTKFKEYPDLDLAIVTTSVEQNAYFRALIKALELVDPSFVGKYKHVGFGWLLFENKKMSSKTGKNIKYTDLIEQAKEIAIANISNEKGYSDNEKEQIANVVAMGALKFAILSHEFHKDINWDIDKFMSMSGFAAPYILYSYARGRSILENCEYKKSDSVKNLDGLYESEVEMELLRKLAEFPGLTEVAGKNLSPHMICRYVFELSELFNRFYGGFNISNEEDLNVREGRLRLVDITTDVIKRALYILGIDTVEQM